MPTKHPVTPTTYEKSQPGFFARAEQGAGKRLADDTIRRLLDPEEGGEFGSAKEFLDRVEVDESDREFARNPDQHKQFRTELTDFVSSHLKMYVPSGTLDTVHPYLRAIKGRYLDKIKDDDAIVSDIIDRASGLTDERTSTSAKRQSAMGYSMLTVQTDKGPRDLIEGGDVAGVRSNVVVLDQIFSHWIRWSSKAYMQAQGRGNKPETERRIYMNPRIKDQVGIFSQVADAVEQAGIHVRGKILDHSLDRFTDDLTYARGDGIVFYVSNEHAEALLSCVKDVHESNKESFAWRNVSKIAREIGSGIAIGDEPKNSAGSSLTSHRAEAIEAAITLTREQVGQEAITTPEAVKLFRQHFGRVATQQGINPQNISFNLK